MTHSQTFPLTSLTCTSCVAKVTTRLLRHPDITAATVTLSPPQAQISTRTPFSDETMDEWLKPLGKYRVQSSAPAAPASASALPQKSVQTYRPLLLLLGYLLLVIAAISISHGTLDLPLAMRLFMGGFFVTFSFFKLLDLRGFADAYRSYDLVAKAWPRYGFIYPFIELSLGLAYLTHLAPLWVNGITALVMAVSLAGVLRAVASRRAIRCACLGTVFQLPMSTVTIIEDGLMLAMALTTLLPSL
ncbi:MAG: heavy-metal-associated domain-containing protein [Prosthecobacter sp.]|uniref:heavy-metal-associated domain-containing protein n=1 Tax=Prosthecobacter sp. TaxID=1965333 RepID=UPI0025CC8244|nr:heavy metal-associated domain-containing protein [Prosthecobacter sp.]MCF7786042.1 heavy-metal-associated domain-containing protein [Prosthecobacter sp.]